MGWGHVVNWYLKEIMDANIIQDILSDQLIVSFGALVGKNVSRPIKTSFSSIEWDWDLADPTQSFLLC
jgi:hypothetical protein